MPQAKKQISQAELKAALAKIDSIYAEFQTELSRLRAERIKIVERINKKADDKKIQEILKKIK